jgi:DNA-binding MarR family transcriptional regulator
MISMGDVSHGDIPAQLSEATGYLLWRATNELRKALDGALAPLGMRARHFGALHALADCPRVQHEVGEQIGVDRTTMVAVSDELERAALVHRVRSRTDRRKIELHLTPRGRETLMKAQAVAAGLQRSLEISEAGRRQLNSALRRLIERYSDARLQRAALALKGSPEPAGGIASRSGTEGTAAGTPRRAVKAATRAKARGARRTPHAAGVGRTRTARPARSNAAARRAEQGAAKRATKEGRP